MRSEGRFGGLQDQEFSENRLRSKKVFFLSFLTYTAAVLLRHYHKCDVVIGDADHAGICSMQDDVK